MKTEYGVLLFAALLMAGGTPFVSESQASTPVVTILVGPAEVKKVSAPSLRGGREQHVETAIIGNLSDSGGTLQHQNFRSGKEVVETDGTEITYSGQHFVGFTQADRRGTREAPVGTVVVTKVEIDKAQPQVFEGTAPVDPDGAAVLPGTMEFPLQSEETYAETMVGAASGTFAS